MKFYIVDYLPFEERKKYEKSGLYCYDLRSSDDGSEIANIEKMVIVNNVGSIITNKKINFNCKNYVDFDTFVSSNNEVFNLKDYEKFKINKIITDDGVIRLKKPVKVSFQIKKNVDEVFKNAINRGMKKPDSWMYMYSERGKDYFKHRDTRCYKAYPQFGMMEAIKKKIQRER